MIAVKQQNIEIKIDDSTSCGNSSYHINSFWRLTVICLLTIFLGKLGFEL